MSFSEEEYAAVRPFLYHLTDRRNVERVSRTGKLQSAATLLELAGQLEHQTFKVRQLVEDYRAGRIVIPEFQREYVWQRSKATRLIDSLYRGVLWKRCNCL